MFKLKHKKNTQVGKMQTKVKNKNTLKRYWIIIAILIALLAGYGAAAYQFNLWPLQSKEVVNLDPATDDEKSTGEKIKSESIETDTQIKETPSNDVNPTVTNANVDFTATTQDDSVYRVRILIGNVLSSGTCTLTATKNDSPTYTSNAPIQAGPSSSTCQGFDIPLTSLKSGVWNLTVSVSSGNTTGSTTKEITVK